MGLKKTFGRLFGFGKHDEEKIQESNEEVVETEQEEEVSSPDADSIASDEAEINEEASEQEKSDSIADDDADMLDTVSEPEMMPEPEADASVDADEPEEEVSEVVFEEAQAKEEISGIADEAVVEEETETESAETEEAEIEVTEENSETEIAETEEAEIDEAEETEEPEENPVTEVNDASEAAVEEKIIEKPKQKIGFFAKLKSGLEKTRKSFNDKIDSVLKAFRTVDEDLFEELEEALIMADVGVETSLYIIGQLRDRVKSNKIKEPSEVKGAIEEIIAEILSENDTTMKLETTPSVIMVIGVNGVGKTTSIGKMAARYKAEGKKVVLGAADTFRAAAIDQLQIWADRSGIDLIKHQEGSDPAAVVFDTISAAKARGADVIILDTAGRLHNKKNLMDELSKIFRVMERELPGCSKETLLVLDATTGQNAVNQVKLFRESADISGIILTKLDGSAKGGIVLAIAHEESIPVKLVGVGEGIDDLQVFNAEDFAKALFVSEN